MLRTDLINLLNQGGVWAFVGSGVSIEAGCPSWRGLLERIVAQLDENNRRAILDDRRYQSALSKGGFGRCFSRIESHVGRDVLETAVGGQFQGANTPGDLLNRLVDWPFAGYITTNYDSLLQVALRSIGEQGWVTIGNTPEEVRKVSGAADHVVWHVHGSLDLPPDKSRLVLADTDYDDLYLEDSRLITQLRGLLAHRRVVFVGFGFRDPEVIRLLRRVGRLCSPVRPAYAFIGFSEGGHEAERRELLERYNVDVIPYRVRNDCHDQLVELLDVYGAFVLRRSLRFGEPARPCPSYDPETTGLLVYNELVLKGEARVSDSIVQALLRSRVLALLRFQGPCTVEHLSNDVLERVDLIRRAARSQEVYDDEIKEALRNLIRLGLVEEKEQADRTTLVSLTAEGASRVADHAAAASRYSDQFSASLQDRARRYLPDNEEAVLRVTKPVFRTLKTE